MKSKILICVMLIMLKSASLKAQFNIGDTLPSFILQNQQNQNVDIASFKGKYLLLDFWASWCAPCRIGNKELVKFDAKADTAKIKIIGISLDNDLKKWKKAIVIDKIKFLQLNDPHRFDAVIAVKLNIEQLPTQLLFNEKGILIAKNPTKEELKKFIK